MAEQILASEQEGFRGRGTLITRVEWEEQFEHLEITGFRNISMVFGTQQGPNHGTRQHNGQQVASAVIVVPPSGIIDGLPSSAANNVGRPRGQTAMPLPTASTVQNTRYRDRRHQSWHNPTQTDEGPSSILHLPRWCLCCPNVITPPVGSDQEALQWEAGPRSVYCGPCLQPNAEWIRNNPTQTAEGPSNPLHLPRRCWCCPNVITPPVGSGEEV